MPVGEIAALKTKCVASDTVPACLSAAAGQVIPLHRLGTSSYQRTTEGAPGPSTVCWVHTPFAPETSGSDMATAWVRRVSSESRTRLLLGCGTFNGKS